MPELRVLILGTDDAFAGALTRALVAQLPGVVCTTTAPEHVRVRPAADALVVDARADALPGSDQARRVRAMGYPGAIVVVGDERRAGSAAERDGLAFVSVTDLASQLVPRLSQQLEAAASPHADLVRRARRLVAAGELAATLQHSLNNPLMGLLAEGQLLQMDPLPAEHAEAVERMMGMCRRMIELTKSLDGLSERKVTS